MYPHIDATQIQIEHRARVAYAERYGHHLGELAAPRGRRRSRVMARLRDRLGADGRRARRIARPTASRTPDGGLVHRLLAYEALSRGR